MWKKNKPKTILLIECTFISEKLSLIAIQQVCLAVLQAYLTWALSTKVLI